MWMWALERNIHITAQHLPGALNCTADTESQTVRDWSEWRLDPAVFLGIERLWGPVEVYLFASRLTHQCQAYLSWRPDPYALATNAFLQDWSGMRGFAKPPCNLIERVLAQIQAQKAQVILITPVWWTQPWYLVLLRMLIDLPRLLPHPIQGIDNKGLCP